jgi:N-acetylglucosaminyl-diphospho-decaprenol L-rhamnosyltransferase
VVDALGLDSDSHDIRAVSIEVCVVAYESEESMERAVRSLYLVGPDVRLAIHDNSSVPLELNNVRRIADELGIPIRIEECAQNCGFARACNSLARSSTADLLLFLNPDAEVLAWPASGRIVASIKGIVGPIVVDWRNRVAPTYGRRRTILEEFLLRWARMRSPRPRGEGYVSGAALLVSRKALLGLDGFDESFFMYYEDIDFCLRANRSGIPVTVETSWVVRHEGGHVAKRDRGIALIRSYDSASYFYAKHGGSVALYRTLCRVDVLIRLALFAVMPSRRSSIPALRRLLAHINTAPSASFGSPRIPRQRAE